MDEELKSVIYKSTFDETIRNHAINNMLSRHKLTVEGTLVIDICTRDCSKRDGDIRYSIKAISYTDINHWSKDNDNTVQ